MPPMDIEPGRFARRRPIPPARCSTSSRSSPSSPADRRTRPSVAPFVRRRRVGRRNLAVGSADGPTAGSEGARRRGAGAPRAGVPGRRVRAGARRTRSSCSSATILSAQTHRRERQQGHAGAVRAVPDAGRPRRRRSRPTSSSSIHSTGFFRSKTKNLIGMAQRARGAVRRRGADRARRPREAARRRAQDRQRRALGRVRPPRPPGRHARRAARRAG